MQKIEKAAQLSASDLVGYLNCRYLTELDLKVANGELEKPKVWDPGLEVLAERGAAHERGFINHLKASGLFTTTIDGVGVDAKSVSATYEAMVRGDPVIVQAALQSGRWNGSTLGRRLGRAGGGQIRVDSRKPLRRINCAGCRPSRRFLRGRAIVRKIVQISINWQAARTVCSGRPAALTLALARLSKQQSREN
jgi:hypothetical protein